MTRLQTHDEFVLAEQPKLADVPGSLISTIGDTELNMLQVMLPHIVLIPVLVRGSSVGELVSLCT